MLAFLGFSVGGTLLAAGLVAAPLEMSVTIGLAVWVGLAIWLVKRT